MKRSILLLIVFLLPLGAEAQFFSVTPREGFTISDQNQDGRVSPAEWRKRWIAYLKNLDRNGDRRISRIEFGPEDPETDGRFFRLDGNRDQTVRSREMTGWADWRFSALDLNQNGMLEWEEFRNETALPGYER